MPTQHSSVNAIGLRRYIWSYRANRPRHVPRPTPLPPKDLTSPWRGYLLPVMDTLHTPCSATRNKRWPTPLGSPGHAHPWFMLMMEGGQEAPKEDGWVEYQSGTKPFSCFSVFLFCLLRDVARHEGWILLSSSLVPEIFLGSSSCEVKDGGRDGWYILGMYCTCLERERGRCTPYSM